MVPRRRAENSPWDQLHHLAVFPLKEQLAFLGPYRVAEVLELLSLSTYRAFACAPLALVGEVTGADCERTVFAIRETPTRAVLRLSGELLALEC